MYRFLALTEGLNNDRHTPLLLPFLTKVDKWLTKSHSFLLLALMLLLLMLLLLLLLLKLWLLLETTLIPVDRHRVHCHGLTLETRGRTAHHHAILR